MNLGFIGLGIMGKPMAKNLIKAGYKLVVYNRSRASVDELAAFGAIPASNAKQVTEQCGIIITMLPNSPDVKAVVCGENGILKGAKPGTIIIDMSSIAPLASKDIYEACREKDVELLDAPVSGGEPKAIEGTLSIMVGGKKEIYDKVYEILMSMGSSAVYCGEIGAGNTTKLANQVIVAANIAALSEALLLAKKAGVDPQLVFSAIRGGLAGSTVMEAKAPMILANNFKPGFKIELHIKDLDNAIDTGHEIGSPLPITAMVMEMMQTLKADGYGGSDHSAIAKYYEKLCGTSIHKE